MRRGVRRAQPAIVGLVVMARVGKETGTSRCMNDMRADMAIASCRAFSSQPPANPTQVTQADAEYRQIGSRCTDSIGSAYFFIILLAGGV
jgi:hypothetical protein